MRKMELQTLETVKLLTFSNTFSVQPLALTIAPWGTIFSRTLRTGIRFMVSTAHYIFWCFCRSCCWTWCCSCHIGKSKYLDITVLTLIRPGFSVYLKTGKGWISPSDFLSFYVLIFYPNQLNMVSNESWHLFPTIESLKTILCSVDFWYGGAEVT